MSNEDDEYFQFTAIAVPHSSMVNSNEDVDGDKFRQFTREELEKLDMRKVRVNIDHNLDENGDPVEDTTVGYIARTMHSNKDSMIVLSEIPPIPKEMRGTPHGEKMEAKRKKAIEAIKKGELTDVSTAHKFDYTYVDPLTPNEGARILVEKKMLEVSLTKTPGRPGSRISEYTFSPVSLLDRASGATSDIEYLEPKCKSYIVVSNNDVNTLPQYVRANLKNFGGVFSVDKQVVPPSNANNEPTESTLSKKMAAQEPKAEIPAPAPVQQTVVPPVQTPIPAPPTQAVPVVQPNQTMIQPGSEVASAYLAEIQKITKERELLARENEALRKRAALFDDVEKRHVTDIRAGYADSNKRFKQSAFQGLESDPYVQTNPEEKQRIEELKKFVDAATERYEKAVIPQFDPSTGVQVETKVDSQSLADLMNAHHQVIHAYNSVIQRRNATELYNATRQKQTEEIAAAKAAGVAAAALPFNGSIPAPAIPPQAAPPVAPPVVSNPVPTVSKSDQAMAFFRGKFQLQDSATKPTKQ